MADLKIRVYKSGEAQPESTVTVPGGVLKLAGALIPKLATDALREKGIDLDEIVRLTSTSEMTGTLIDVDDHKRGERIVISIE